MGAMLGQGNPSNLVPPSDLANVGLKPTHSFETGPHGLRRVGLGLGN